MVSITAGQDPGDNNLTNNLVYSNTGAGLYAQNQRGTRVAGDRYYNNNPDLQIGGSDGPSIINLSQVVIDNPAGSMLNYTTISINDVVDDATGYTVKWLALPPTRPENRTSFRNKFIDISTASGSVIDEIVWHWSPAESAPYDQSKFEMWKYNSTNGWENLSATLDPSLHTLTLLNLNPASGFGPLQDITFQNVTFTNVNITNVTNMDRWGVNTSFVEQPTAGSNLTMLDLDGQQLTGRWAAFYGNVNRTVYLTSNNTGVSAYLYRWSPPVIGSSAVCASVNSTLGLTSVSGAIGSDIDVVWGFPADVIDSGANTFTGVNCNLSLGAVLVNSSSYADTGSAGVFKTCVLKTKANPTSKSDLIFCSNITSGGQAWNGNPADFELMVPTTYGPTATETYYLYMSVD
ncbi:Uncharacterised protein [uncultured archaeon]|nr:Uncharacterised protein [uncultured archaeon]